MCKVLIVDDEQAEREGMKYLIGRIPLSLAVDEAANGAAALERLQEKDDVDILLTDIEMPFMDGLELCERVHMLRPQMKTVIFSAYNQFEYAQKAIDAGVTSYMLKPVRASRFEELICRLYNDWQKDKSTRKALPAAVPENAPAGEGAEKVPRRIIRKVLGIIEKEYSKEIGLDYIAGKVYLTPCYLSTLFKREMGITLVSYIKDYRLDRARELLADSSLRAADVSRSVGYDNLPYFYTLFKARFGMTPSEFRENT